MYIHMHTYNICTFVHSHTCNTYINTNKHIRLRTMTHTYIHAYMHTNTHTHIYIHTYKQQVMSAVEASAAFNLEAQSSYPNSPRSLPSSPFPLCSPFLVLSHSPFSILTTTSFLSVPSACMVLLSFCS